ncbi:hypothetical protein C8J57DRAFT_1087112 [Mycena rebaudengoi]|nr:hypothetical protein C8J57DRAFT_1087112 [Mycena rebaudengoi]
MAEPSTITLIAPAGPTLLDGLSTLPIDNLNVSRYNTANSYIVPEIIDVKRFKDALNETLVLFPLYAARVKCAEGGGVPWTITLPPLGIPLTISSSPETSLVPIEAIVQEPLRFLPLLSPRKIVLDPTAPLAAILLTKFPALGVTSIGIARWHPIGSDYVASRFIRALSRFYAGELEPDEPQQVYKLARLHLPAPDPKLLEGIDSGAVEAYYPAISPHPQLDPSKPANVRLDFRLSAPQVQQLHAAIHASGGPNANFLTKQDCLVALVAVATNAADPSIASIHTIDTILDVRGAAGVPSELSFNGLMFAPTDRIVPERENEYYTYAAAVRKSIMRAREPAFLSALVDLQAAKAAEVTNRGETMDLASKPGHILCNSTLRYVPFTLRSYVGTVPFLRHLKLARPNPVESADGSWRERLDVTEVTLYFQLEVRDWFGREIDERLKALGVEGVVEWVEPNTN